MRFFRNPTTHTVTRSHSSIVAHTQTHAHGHAYMHAHIKKQICARKLTHTKACRTARVHATNTHAHKRTRAQTHTHTQARMTACVHAHKQTRTQTCTHAHLHTFIYKMRLMQPKYVHIYPHTINHYEPALID